MIVASPFKLPHDKYYFCYIILLDFFFSINFSLKIFLEYDGNMYRIILLYFSPVTSVVTLIVPYIFILTPRLVVSDVDFLF